MEPHNHRVNVAEPAVKSVKYHMLATFATMDKNFPMQVWNKFTKQMQDTLNLLHTAREDPTKSAYEALEGEPFDFNATPMAIVGCKALAFCYDNVRSRLSATNMKGIDAWWSFGGNLSLLAVVAWSIRH